PAVTRNRRGKGEVRYYGAVFNAEEANKILDSLNLSSPAAEWLELPPEVELQIRKNDKSRYAFQLNYSEEAVTITPNEHKNGLLTGETLSGSCKLEGFGVRVLY
ncbi:hypothetical protein AMQ83_25350, partial [Paenibacillus riograndensis]